MKRILVLIAALGCIGCTANPPSATGEVSAIESEAANAGAAIGPSETEVSAAEADAPTTVIESPEADAQASESTSDESGLAYRDFTAYRADGTVVTLSDYIGVPIVLNFWATWCGPCRVEMPGFDTLEDEFPEVLFFMVNLTDGDVDTPEKVESYLTDSGLTFNNVLLDIDADAQITYGVSSIPVTLFINADGQIVDGKLGMMEESALRDAVEKLCES